MPTPKQKTKQQNETQTAGLLRQLRQQRSNLESEVDNMKTNFVGARVSKVIIYIEIFIFTLFRHVRRSNVNQAR